MTELHDQANALSMLIEDYRSGSIDTIDCDHILRWTAQFANDVQIPILRELNHVFNKTYLSRQKAIDFLSQVVTSPKLSGEDPAKFWKEANLLDIQLAGNSQSDVLSLLDQVLKSKFEFSKSDTGKGCSTFIYLDDGMFTGNRIRRDLEAWLPKAPKKAALHVIVFALYRGTYFGVYPLRIRD